VTSGRVSHGRHDVRDVRIADLRSACGLVSQDVFLFHGTVRENLVYGAPDASDDEVVRAAELAEAHDFVHRLPPGTTRSSASGASSCPAGSGNGCPSPARSCVIRRS
jgi:ABC-type multidrug transport system fused ATPase/permease subunit